jgi:hypothetical protein
MEKEDEDDVLLKNVYDVIYYYLKQMYIKTPLKMKKSYQAVPSKYREIAERNRVIVGALVFILYMKFGFNSSTFLVPFLSY